MQSSLPPARKFVKSAPENEQKRPTSLQKWRGKQKVSKERVKGSGERDTRLVAAYTDHSSVSLMLEYLGVPGGPLEGAYFDCVLGPSRKKGSHAVLQRNERGEFGYLAFSRKHKKPLFLTLGEVFANVHHGYKWPDERLTKSPTVLAFYHARLAVEAGESVDEGDGFPHRKPVVPIERTRLPLLPLRVIRALRNGAEAYYAAALVCSFGLRLDLGREFVPQAFENANGCVMFARDFRRHWVNRTFYTIGAAYGGGPEPVLPDERLDTIWYLLVHQSDVVEQLQLRSQGRTVYRWGQAPLVAEPPEVFRDVFRKWNAVHG